jgi:hypothetical protein
VPNAEMPELIGMAPALAAGLLTVAGFVVLAVVRTPFSPLVTAASVAIALFLSGGGFLRARRGVPPTGR